MSSLPAIWRSWWRRRLGIMILPCYVSEVDLPYLSMLLYCLSKVVSTSASKLRTDVGDGPNPTFSVHQTGISLPLPLRPLSVSDVVGLAGHPKHKNHSIHKLYDHLYDMHLVRGLLKEYQ